VTNDRLGQKGGPDQGIKIDAGGNTHLFAHQNQIFGADISGCTPVSRKRAATKSRDSRIELINPHFEARICVCNAEPTCVVEVKIDGKLWEAVLHGTNNAFDGQRRGPRHRVGKRQNLDRQLVAVCDSENTISETQDSLQRDFASEITAKCGSDGSAVDRNTEALARCDRPLQLREMLFRRAVQIACKEFLGSVERDFAFDMQLARGALYSTPGRGLIRFTTSAASAIPGTRFGLTKDTVSMCFRPVAASASIRRALSRAAIGPGSI
jgi:hypothetical protein